MAKNETVEQDTTEIDELAFRLYAERIAKAPAQINGEQSSIWAYRRAKEFLAVRDQLRAGNDVTAVPTGPQLADACCPNLKPTHPHNLVSRRFGDLSKVKVVYDWLDKHPPSETDPVAYAPYDWDVPTTNLARELFPCYVSKN